MDALCGRWYINALGENEKSGDIAANQHIPVANQGTYGYDYNKGRGGKAEEASCLMY